MIKAQERKKTVVATVIAMDYPKEGEHITNLDYTFRITAKGAGQVEIAVDNNEWQHCRQADGFWWYDWAGYTSGKHQAVARIKPENDGKERISRTTRFQVELQ